MQIYNTGGKIVSDIEDALCELGNAGTGMASIVLGRMMNIRVSIGMPQVTVTRDKVMLDTNIAEQGEAVAIVMNMRESINGTVAFIAGRGFIVSAVEKLTGKTYLFEEIMTDEYAFSAVQEFGSLIGHAYVKALGAYTQIRFFLSPAIVCVDTAENLINSICLHLEHETARRVYVECGYLMVDADGTKIGSTGHIIMMPDTASVEKLMQSIGM